MSDKSLPTLIAKTNILIEELLTAGSEKAEIMLVELAELDTAVAEKIDSYAWVLDRLKFETDYWEKKAEEYTRVKTVLKNAQKRLKDRLKYIMTVNQTVAIYGRDTKFMLCSAKKSLEIDESILPDHYFKETVLRLPDKSKIENDLKSGIEIHGARLTDTTALRRGMNHRSIKPPPQAQE